MISSNLQQVAFNRLFFKYRIFPIHSGECSSTGLLNPDAPPTTTTTTATPTTESTTQPPTTITTEGVTPPANVVFEVTEVAFDTSGREREVEPPEAEREEDTIDTTLAAIATEYQRDHGGQSTTLQTEENADATPAVEDYGFFVTSPDI